MKVDILIYEDNIKSAVQHCIMIGKKPTIRNVKSIIREMVVKYGEVWTTEPTFDTFEEDTVVSWEEAEKLAQEIAPSFFDKIF